MPRASPIRLRRDDKDGETEHTCSPKKEDKTAAKFGVPSVFFSAYSASTLCFLGQPDELKFLQKRTKIEDFVVPPKWLPFPSMVSQRPDQAAQMLRKLKFPDISGMSSGQSWAATLEGCDYVAVRSCMEFEGAFLGCHEELYQKPILPVGLLPRSPVKNSDSHIDPNWCSTFHWLDKQGPKSVVFVGFGNEYKMPIEQVRELAYGVELSELPFIWILRKPEGVGSSELLPDGFLARISNRGMLLVEKGIGFEIQRNKDGSFNQDVVAKSMRLVMVDKEEEPLRLKAAQMKTIFGNQNLHENYINDFIHYMGIYQQKGHQMPIKDAEKL
ncbi:UDP-glycosyltransferase 91C1 [Quercus suber]|uniref:UDP-glycosyltransferase 91C1 n=1 Tax=Quercus suber TaxID=58331 RepID=UPI000CE267D3|nr:UDP-glycosyltransferase 91C1-like [Quercus suber]